MLVSNINSGFTFENFKNFVMRKHMERKRFLMLHRLILKVTKFQLPPPKRLGTVVKNIFF